MGGAHYDVDALFDVVRKTHRCLFDVFCPVHGLLAVGLFAVGQFAVKKKR